MSLFRRLLRSEQLGRSVVAFCTGLTVFFAAGLLAAEGRVVVEVGDRAELLVERNFVRRLVQLELSDVDVPPPHHATSIDSAAGLYVRILRVDRDLIVQLWDRGELQGQRRLTVRGGKRLRARRVALVSAELARGLAARRAFLARRARRASLRSRRRENQRAERLHRRQPTLGSEMKFASLGAEDAWMLGPGLTGRYVVSDRLQVSLSLAALTGYSRPLRSAFQWLEVGLRPAYVWELSRRTSIAAGPDIAAAFARIARSHSVDGIEGRSETWSARAGLFVHWRQQLSRSVLLSTGPEIGVLLRPIEAAPRLSEARRLSPLWLGLSVGVHVSGI